MNTFVDTPDGMRIRSGLEDVAEADAVEEVDGNGEVEEFEESAEVEEEEGGI